MSARTAPTTITLGKYFWGLGASLLALLIGAWLMVAPFALGYQPYGDSWTGATTNDFWLGLAVVVVSLVGLALFAGSLLGDLRAIGVIQPRPQPQPQPQPAAPVGPPGGFRTPVSPADDLERTLATLASALAADLTQRRAAESGRPTQPFADTPGDIEAPRRAAEAGRPAQQLAGAAGDADAQRRAVEAGRPAPPPVTARDGRDSALDFRAAPAREPEVLVRPEPDVTTRRES